MLALLLATILLFYAPPNVLSVLVLFVIFGSDFQLIIGRPTYASLAASVVFPMAFISLCSLC